MATEQEDNRVAEIEKEFEDRIKFLATASVADLAKDFRAYAQEWQAKGQCAMAFDLDAIIKITGAVLVTEPPRATIDDLRGWMERDLTGRGTLARRVQIISYIGTGVRDVATDFRVRVFTSKNSYTITARNPKQVKTKAGELPQRVIVRTETVSVIDEVERGINADDVILDIKPNGDVHVFRAKFEMDAGYLGCTSSSRTPRPGEDHTRGNDLADGPLTEDTWRRILADIVSYELQPLAKQKEPKGLAPPATETLPAGYWTTRYEDRVLGGSLNSDGSRSFVPKS